MLSQCNLSNPVPPGSNESIAFSKHGSFPYNKKTIGQLKEFHGIRVWDARHLWSIKDFFKGGKGVAIMKCLHDEIVGGMHLFQMKLLFLQGLGILFGNDTLSFLICRQGFGRVETKAKVGVSIRDACRAASNLVNDKR